MSSSSVSDTVGAWCCPWPAQITHPPYATYSAAEARYSAEREHTSTREASIACSQVKLRPSLNVDPVHLRDRIRPALLHPTHIRFLSDMHEDKSRRAQLMANPHLPFAHDLLDLLLYDSTPREASQSITSSWALITTSQSITLVRWTYVSNLPRVRRLLDCPGLDTTPLL